MNNPATESKHTPGPWKFSEWEQFGETRFYISQDDGAPYTPNYSDVAHFAAETCSGEWLHIQKANARLIAAAPTLLEVLRELCALEADGKHASESAIEIWERARAALHQSTGGAEHG